MSDQTPLAISVDITTRAQMNTSTPRFGSWTYHHVLPVRLYFMTAWTMLCVGKHSACWKSTRKAARDALVSMCQNAANANNIKLFLDEQDDAPASAELALRAKLCASPPFGGFGGPNPGQRADDPHEMPERWPPASAPAVWWTSLKLIGEALRDAYALRALPAPNSTVTTTKTVAEWCQTVEAMAVGVAVAAESGGVNYDATDWVPFDDGFWTVQPGRPLAGDPNLSIKLRRRAAPITYLRHDQATQPQLAGAWRLARLDDELKIPAPPLPPRA